MELTAKQFIKDITIRELMLLTNDVANMLYIERRYTDEQIDRIAGDEDNGLKDVDTLTNEDCHKLIREFMAWVNGLRHYIYVTQKSYIEEYGPIELNCDQLYLDNVIYHCLYIAKNVKGFKRFLNKKERDEIANIGKFVTVLEY